METMIKIINKRYLKLNDFDNGKTYHIDAKGSKLFYGTDENGKNYMFSRNEIKKLGGIPGKIEEVLELEKLANYDLGVFSEDGLNFITFIELKNMEKMEIDVSEFKKVKFKIMEG